MDSMTTKHHWENIYSTKSVDEMSWTQQRPDLSLALIAESGITPDAGILDVGGGTSPLAGYLLEAGYAPIGVLDISAAALERSRELLGHPGGAVQWYEADVTTFVPPHRFGLWHDRAVFHFLTEPEDRERYVRTLERTLKPDGFVILAAFAPDGPEKCSGLPIVRYDETSLAAELGSRFTLLDVRYEVHSTPWQSEQRFIYCLFQYTSIG